MQKAFQNRPAFSLKNAINSKACSSLSDKPIQSHYSVKYPKNTLRERLFKNQN
ncbi:hypothetical protein JT052_07155 [Helicobacter pylori]|nr:hypothetical protein [Helicobacter pylori]